MARAIDADALKKELAPYEENDFSQQIDVILKIVDAQPTLTPPNEWVSVDNKLPKNGVPVLIGNPHWDYPVVASCAGYGVWMDSWHQKMTFTPTYWMPLPERPKEDE